jgi:predicted RecB family nuclease
VSQPRRTRITAQDFYDFDKCPHRVYLNRYGDPAEKLPESDFLNLLFENGTTHAWEVVKELEYETPTGDSLEERAASTVKLMKRGAKLIYQGVLLQSDRVGIPDLLERVPGKSKFGKYFYRPVDIKAGSGFAVQAKGTLRHDYGMQLSHYGELLKRIQSKFPPRAEIRKRSFLAVLCRRDATARGAAILTAG